MLLAAGADEAFVKNQLGHADIKTTQSHYHRNIASMEDTKKWLSVVGF